MLCSEANTVGRDDEAVVDAAKGLHWQLFWTSGYHFGKRLRRRRGQIEVRGFSLLPLASPPLTDVRRMLNRLEASDLAGFGKAFCEALPMRKTGCGARCGRGFQKRAFFAPSHRLHLVTMHRWSRRWRSLPQDPELKTRPVEEEDDRCVELAWSTFEWLSGRTYRGLSKDPIPSAHMDTSTASFWRSPPL